MASRSINEKLRDRQRELIERVLSFIFRKSMHTRTWPSFFFTGTMLANQTIYFTFLQHPAAINLSTAASIFRRSSGRKRGCACFTGFFSLSTASLWTTRHLLKMKWKKSRDSRLHVHFPLFSRHVCADESRSPIFLRPKVHLKEIINCSLSTFLELRRSRFDFRHLLRSALKIRVLNLPAGFLQPIPYLPRP